MEYKRFPVEDFDFKASGDHPGYFRALVSVFNNVDDGGDRVVPGAFRKTLKSNPRPPVVWSHQWNIPPIGQTQKARETDHGLEIEGQLLLEDDGISGEYARSVLSGFKAGALNQFSFAFDVKDAEEVEEKGVNVRELREVEVFEVGPTLIGMNRDTTLLEVASSERDLDRLADKIAARMQKAQTTFTYSIQTNEELEKAAIGSHSTGTTEGTWDGNAAMTRASSSSSPARAFRGICAWYSGSNPDERQSYKFPHHNVAGGPAVLAGVRNALARVPQANIPSGDVSGVQAHLNAHLNKSTSADEAAASSPPDEGRAAALAEYRELLSLVPR